MSVCLREGGGRVHSEVTPSSEGVRVVIDGDVTSGQIVYLQRKGLL